MKVQFSEPNGGEWAPSSADCFTPKYPLNTGKVGPLLEKKNTCPRKVSNPILAKPVHTILTELSRLDRFFKDIWTRLPTLRSRTVGGGDREKQNRNERDQTITASSVLGESRWLLNTDQPNHYGK